MAEGLSPSLTLFQSGLPHEKKTIWADATAPPNSRAVYDKLH